MLEIFELIIIKRAFLVATLIAPLASVLGVFLLMRRYAFFADTLAHVGFLALALSLFLKINSLFLLLLLSIIISVFVEQLRSKGKLPAEGSLLFFLYAGVALSVVFLSFSKSNVSVMHILFGSLSTVSAADMYLIYVGVIVCGIFLIKFYKPLLNLSIDEEIAHAMGININRLKTFFAITVAISISISIKTMGALLIGSLMIIPPLSAMLFCKSLRSTVIFSIIFALLSSYGGIFLSFYSDIPLGASVSTILILVFIFSFVIQKIR